MAYTPLMLDTQSSTWASSPWKRIVVRDVVGGAAAGMVLLIGVISLYLYSERPKKWNKGAIRSVSVEALPMDRLDNHWNEESSGINFTVALENTTTEDVTIPSSVTLPSVLFFLLLHSASSVNPS